MFAKFWQSETWEFFQGRYRLFKVSTFFGWKEYLGHHNDNISPTSSALFFD